MEANAAGIVIEQPVELDQAQADFSQSYSKMSFPKSASNAGWIQNVVLHLVFDFRHLM